MKKGFSHRVAIDFKKNKYLFIMILPVLVYYLVFHYAPMYGALIAFKNYTPRIGVLNSPWVGFKNFEKFLSNANFWGVFKNTIAISLGQIAFGFPAPIILALLLNEVRHNKYKRTVQTITYMPHFVSVMVICGILVEFCSTEGILTQLVSWITGEESRNLLLRADMFRPIYIVSGIWQEVGFGSIIYLSALAGIDSALYEAGSIDGANRWKMLIHITIPGILSTIVVMFILRIGRIMGVGYEKILLLYNASTYETADVISSFVYRRGLLDMDYSFGAAIDLMNSVINMIILFTFNWLSKKMTEKSLW